MINLSEIKERILTTFLPEYEEVVRILDSYSDYELELIKDSCQEDIDDLSNAITKAVQLEIIEALFAPIINNWDDFYLNNEDLLMDYCSEATIIEYDYRSNSYCIFKDTIIDDCKSLIKEVEGEYSINEDVDFRDIISNLNKYYPIKFSEG